MDRLRVIEQSLARFKAERPELQRNNWSDSMALFILLLGEVQELGAELAANNEKEIPKELADVIIFSLEIAQHYGIDVYTAVIEKIARNFAKFPPERLQGDVPYDVVMPNLKREWRESGGDEHYYQNGVTDDVRQLEKVVFSASG